jgi:hypothetical protein
LEQRSKPEREFFPQEVLAHITNLCIDTEQSRSMVEFETVYIVPGNKLLGNTFGFFIVGAEALIVGNITGFDEGRGAWKVVVSSLLRPAKI